MLRIIKGILLFLALLCAPATFAQYPAGYELLCPPATSPATSIQPATTLTGTDLNGLFKANACVDNNGNLVLNTNVVGLTGSGNPIVYTSMKCDTRRVGDGTITLGSSIVSSPTINFTAADVGRTFWGVTTGTAYQMPLGKIVTVSSSTTATTNQTAINNISGAEIFTIGDDDTAAFRAGIAAAIAGHAILQLPPGTCMVGLGATGPIADLSVNGGAGFTMRGAGMPPNPPPPPYSLVGGYTLFYITPDFTETGTSVGNFIQSGSNTSITIQDFGVDDLNSFRTGAVNNLISLVSNNHAYRILTYGWHFYGTNNDTMAGLLISGTGATVQDGVNASNDLGCSVSFASQTLFLNTYCGNSYRSLLVNHAQGNPAGGGVTFVGGISDECGPRITTDHCTDVLNSSKDVRFVGYGGFSAATGNISAGTDYALHVDGTSQVDSIGSDWGQFGGIGAGHGAGILIDAGGLLSITDSKYWSSTGLNYINNAGTLYDLGGNRCGDAGCGGTYSGSSTIFPLILNAETQLGGSQVVNGTAPTCAVTGGGTGATCTFDTGSTNGAGNIVITAGTAPASSGTVTVTYATPSTTPPNGSSCSANLFDGTGTWNASASLPHYTALSTTQSVFGWGNNAVALTATQTYKFSYTCYFR